MRISELVQFSKDQFFNGAVQSDWFYNKELVEAVATSYVFHGPKYFGVGKTDIAPTRHQLIDTASFAKSIANRVYDVGNGSPFVMTIAGYGAGKSHLAVALAALFSESTGLRNRITTNICGADKEIGDYIGRINNKNNLVIVLNGMKNFNLDSEILRCVKLSLSQCGIDDSFLKTLTRSYDYAKRVVRQFYDDNQKLFITIAEKNHVRCHDSNLKTYLIDNLESDAEALSVVNQVHIELLGEPIRFEQGLSAGEVLSLIAEKLCGDGGVFNKVILLFDEFGRYVEYVAAQPVIAGEAAMQQIFESVQNAKGKIVFTGFIQSELSAYLSRIESSSNIVRYVGRYESSDKYYLSTNFETILANLLIKNSKNYDRVIGAKISQYQRFFLRIRSSLNRWDRSAIRKSVWANDSLYENVILKGCYPLHPITVWLLANISNWMQQRSTIAFANEMYAAIKEKNIGDGWLPFVYPTDVVDSSIYNEMLNSEEKGLVTSQNCMLYRDIMQKTSDRLTDNEVKVLKAILIINICRFSFMNKEDALTAVRYCTDLLEDDVKLAFQGLEDLHGVVTFDDNAKVFELVAEASGLNEFKRFYKRYSMGVSASIEDCDEETIKEIGLSKNIETSFSYDHNISSLEWSFKQVLLPVEAISSDYLDARIQELKRSNTGDLPRGLLIYAYCDREALRSISLLQKMYNTKKLKEHAIIIIFLNDGESNLIKYLKGIKVLSKFSAADKARFEKHYETYQKGYHSKVVAIFRALVQKRQMIGASGIETYATGVRIAKLCSEKFESLYTKAPPFAFDGFEKQTRTQANRYLTNICKKLFDQTLMNVQSYQALSSDEKNRVKACLSTGIGTSWQVFDGSCNLVEPRNKIVGHIFESVSHELSADEPSSVFSVFDKYTQAPYGMNYYSIALFFMYFIAIKGNKVLSYYESEKLNASHLNDKVFKRDKLAVAELRKIRIQENPNADTDVVADLCKRILRETSVSKCAVLQTKLKDLVSAEGTTADNQLLVADTNAFLDAGVREHQKQIEVLRQLNEYIAEARIDFNIPKFIRFVFQFDFSPKNPIISDLPFVYDDDYLNKLQSLRSEIDSLIKSKYMRCLPRIQCEITQLSQIKAIYRVVNQRLRENGYNEFADATEKRIKELEERLVAEQKYEKAFAELDRDISMSNNVSTYSAIRDLSAKLSNWEIFISRASDIPSAIKQDYSSRIKAGIQQLDKQRKGMEERITSAISKARNAQSVDQLLTSEKELEGLRDIGFNEKDVSRILDVLAEIGSVKEKIGSLPSRLDKLKKMSKPVGNYSMLIELELSRAIKLLETKQINWIREFLYPVEGKISRLSASFCSNWLSQTQVLPEFLESDIVDRYESARKDVEVRLHCCRVEGVVSMFMNLSKTEQEECLRIINSKK